jgi:DNA invertase Pin-like site-specific DNA recombinase
LLSEHQDQRLEQQGKAVTRPGLEQLRSDLKTDLFDVVHFLAADRIARRSAGGIKPDLP